MKKNDIDIDLIQIIEIIKSSKISLIVSIVFTVLIASYYGISRPDPSSLYSSSALIKIGSFQEVENYQIDMWSNKSDKLIMNEKKIESMESTIDYLTSKFILIPSFSNSSQESVYKRIEKKSLEIIEVQATGKTEKKSQKGITDLINDISKKHKNLFEKELEKINQNFDQYESFYLSQLTNVEIELNWLQKNIILINDQMKIENHSAADLTKLQSERNELEYQAEVLIESQNTIISNLNITKKFKSEFLEKSNFINTQLAGEIATNNISDTRYPFTSILMIGFFLGILLFFFIVSAKISFHLLNTKG